MQYLIIYHDENGKYHRAVRYSEDEVTTFVQGRNVIDIVKYPVITRRHRLLAGVSAFGEIKLGACRPMTPRQIVAAVRDLKRQIGDARVVVTMFRDGRQYRFDSDIVDLADGKLYRIQLSPIIHDP